MSDNKKISKHDGANGKSDKDILNGKHNNGSINGDNYTKPVTQKKRKKKNSSFLRFIAIFIIAVAIVIKRYPTILLRIPNIGFILHIIVTQSSLPPCFTADAWTKEEMQTWIKDGDVVVATGVKSGTHWMLYCTHQIRMKASEDADEVFGDVNYATPFIDMLHHPDNTWSKEKELYNTTILSDGTRYKDKWDNPVFPFRVFKSHFSPKEAGGYIPVRSFPKVKFIAMSRNGLDVVRSAIPFFDQFTEEFRSDFGGFPPPSNKDPKQTGEERMSNFLPGGCLYEFYFQYVKKWWQLRHDANVLLLHYADVKRNLSDTVRRISEFLNVELTEQQHEEVTRRCGLDHMKSINHRFMIHLPLNHRNPDMKAMKKNSILRTGRIGEGHDYFTADQRANWREAEEREFGDDPALLEWARNGGGYD